MKPVENFCKRLDGRVISAKDPKLSHRIHISAPNIQGDDSVLWFWTPSMWCSLIIEIDWERELWGVFLKVPMEETERISPLIQLKQENVLTSDIFISSIIIPTLTDYNPYWTSEEMKVVKRLGSKKRTTADDVKIITGSPF
jgi:hypothetical protein